MTCRGWWPSWHVGTTCTRRCSGPRRSTTRRRCRRDAIFRIASLTKPIAAAGAMVLVDDGVLSLGDPVETFLPELADRRVLRSLESPLDDTVPAERSITVEDLLTFRLGFGSIMAPPGSYPDSGGRGGARPDDAGAAVAAATVRLRRVDPALRHAAPAAPAGCRVALQHGRARPGRPAGAGERAAARVVPAGTPVRAARHGGHVVQRPGGEAGAASPRPTSPTTRPAALAVLDRPDTGWWSEPPAMANAAGMLVSTLEDLWAFVSLLLAGGRHEGRAAAVAGRRWRR